MANHHKKRHNKSARGHRRKQQGNCPIGRIEIKSEGYGFIDTDEGSFFVPANRMGGAMNGDLVEVRPRSEKNNPGQRRVASVIRVHERVTEYVVGTLRVHDPLAAVVPQDPRLLHDIFVDLSLQKEVVHDGDVVLARITHYPNRRVAAQGYIVEVLGQEENPGMDVDIIIHNAGLETEFSQQACNQAEKIAQDSRFLEKTDDLGNLGPRQDLTAREVFTIDPEDAKDFDDAISIDHVDGLVRLGVHIADVAHYVPWDSSIDLCARSRATSVYLVDRVLSMLPQQLSDDICSLKPGVNRLTITCDMFLDEESAQLVRYKIYPSIICSKRRFSYDEVQGILDGSQDHGDIQDYFAPKLKEMNGLAHKLVERRKKRGALDFDSVEAKPILNEMGEVEEIKLRIKNDATSMIEEAMILANEVVATHLFKAQQPCVYRVHEAPRPSNIESLASILKAQGFPVAYLRGGTPAAYQQLLKDASKTQSKSLVESLVLRAMERAHYSTDALSHFGLASEHYCHFTSPIRRYPDIMVHRLLRDPHAMEGQLDWLAQHASKMERAAEQAEDDSVHLKLCEYLSGFVGDIFTGIIVGLQSSGFFVRLECTAQGYVHFDPIKDEYFSFDVKKQLLVGEETGHIYRFGQRVQVRLEGVDLRMQSIDLRIC